MSAISEDVSAGVDEIDVGHYLPCNCRSACGSLGGVTERSQQADADRRAPVDCVVVGAGVAGLSAALFLGRAGRSTIVFDAGPQRILAVESVREYLGHDGEAPADLLARARTEVLGYSVDVVGAHVDAITARSDGLFEVAASDLSVTARAVVLATGTIDELPEIAGISDTWGRDLHVCPCFDGYELRNGPFVVIGEPERLAYMASWVWMWCRDVTVVSPHQFNAVDAERLALLGIDVVDDEVASLIHEDQRLVAVTTSRWQRIPCNSIWAAVPWHAASDLAASLCDVDDRGLAIVDADGQTSRPGVWAVGNASNPVAHVAHAAAAGTNVGPFVTLYLLEGELAARREQRREAEAR